MLLWEDRQSSTQRACYLPSLSRYPFIHLGREEQVRVRCLAQGHNTWGLGFKLKTLRSWVRSTTAELRVPLINHAISIFDALAMLCLKFSIFTMPYPNSGTSGMSRPKFDILITLYPNSIIRSCHAQNSAYLPHHYQIRHLSTMSCPKLDILIMSYPNSVFRSCHAQKFCKLTMPYPNLALQQCRAQNSTYWPCHTQFGTSAMSCLTMSYPNSALRSCHAQNSAYWPCNNQIRHFSHVMPKIGRTNHVVSKLGNLVMPRPKFGKLTMPYTNLTLQQCCAQNSTYWSCHTQIRHLGHVMSKIRHTDHVIPQFSTSVMSCPKFGILAMQ